MVAEQPIMKQRNSLQIYEELDSLKSNYETGSSEKIEGLYRSPYKIIKMCEYYANSRYLQSNPIGVFNKDPLGRDMPFYNIVNFRVSLAKTATDLDIKDIQIISDNPKHRVQSMLLNREAYEWMKEDNFGLTLNKMGSTRPKYGGYLLKKTTENGKLKITVADWTKTYTDLNDIMGGAIVECHNMSPVALKKKDGAWEGIDDVLRAHKKNKDESGKIEVYEVTGEFPKSIYKNFNHENETESDEFLFSLQKYFIAEVSGVKFPLYSEELSGSMEDYYEYLSWEDNSLDLGRGVIEDSEEAQVWTNDAVVNEKNAMDLAGRVGIKTNSKKLGSNILEHDHGKIYELGINEDINAFNLAPSALGQYQNQIEKWKVQANDATSSYNSQTGEQPPSGTPYSQTALLNQVGSKPFDYKREEWGIHLAKIFNKWVIPYLVKKLRKPHTLVSSNFTDVELEMIDESIANYDTNRKILDDLFENDNLATPFEQNQMMEGVKAGLKKTGKKRFIEIPEKYFDDIEAKVTVVTTGEQKNKAVILQSLSTILQTVQGSFNPNTGTFGILEDPTLKKIFDEIVELSGTGISPVSLGGRGASGVTTPTQAAPAPAAAQQSPSIAPTQ